MRPPGTSIPDDEEVPTDVSDQLRDSFQRGGKVKVQIIPIQGTELFRLDLP